MSSHRRLPANRPARRKRRKSLRPLNLLLLGVEALESRIMLSTDGPQLPVELPLGADVGSDGSQSSNTTTTPSQAPTGGGTWTSLASLCPGPWA